MPSPQQPFALTAAPTLWRTWFRGAEGEERVAAAFARHLQDGAVVLHDRRIPGSRANIDHIVVAPTGVRVVDPKRYKGRLQVSAPLFGSETLTINGRDRTKLIDGLERQVDVVRAQLAAAGADVPVHGALCFVDTELPWLGSTKMRGFRLLGPRRLCRQINGSGAITIDRAREVAGELAARFPSA